MSLINEVNINIWGRDFSLPVKYDCYENEEVIMNQKEALQNFMNNGEFINNSLDNLKEYCLSLNGNEIEAKEISNIFKYVIPKYLFVPRSENNRLLALMCNYRFDMEHGIAIVFCDEKLKEIGIQDIVL